MTNKNLQQVQDALERVKTFIGTIIVVRGYGQEQYSDICTSLATLDRIMGDYVLVPKEPTEEMLEDGYYMDCVDIAKLKRSYKAMIAAAPKHGGE